MSCSNHNPTCNNNDTDNTTSESLHFHAVHSLTTAQIQANLDDIARFCTGKGLRFTPLRRLVLQLILEANQPIGAYDLLAKLNTGKKAAAPPTVYRSLDFLLDNGFIHRLASINAYIPCCHPREAHEAAFLICQNCNAVQEFSKNPLFAELDTIIGNDGFVSKHMMVEISGLCRLCHQASEIK